MSVSHSHPLMDAPTDSHPLSSVVLGGLKDHLKEIKRCKRLIMIGCGTSFHAAVAVSIAISVLTNTARKMRYWCKSKLKKNHDARQFRAISHSMLSNCLNLLLNWLGNRKWFRIWHLKYFGFLFGDAALQFKGKTRFCRMNTFKRLQCWNNQQHSWK